MIKSGVISNKETKAIASEQILLYLKEELNRLDDHNQILFDLFKKRSIVTNEEYIIFDFFITVLGYVIVKDNNVYYPSEKPLFNFNKEKYIKEGYSLKKESSLYLVNNRLEYKQLSQDEAELEMLALETSESLENNLSYWYNKIENVGFKTPKTAIIFLNKSETNKLKNRSMSELEQLRLLNKIVLALSKSGLSIYDELFIRLDQKSNKFNFMTSHIEKSDELLPKLNSIFEDLYFDIEWTSLINIVVREFIKPNYKRKEIYNGMPLNTEFRVFYDFDKKEVIGIFNYWDRNEMIDNLPNKNDLINFICEIDKIEADFNELKEQLNMEVKKNIENVELINQWSIDFLYDGKNFILIDMARAECSHYYEKIPKQKRKTFSL